MSAADQIEGAPHPRDTPVLYGQEAAEQAFLAAHATGRLHHGWLLSGPRGVGKATLAWSIARFLLATPPLEDEGLFGAPPAPTTLRIDPDHPVARRMAAGAEPGLKVITRTPSPTTDRLRDQIVVDDIRALAGFFHLSATDGGRRVVIVDAADEMNPSAANALLKMLEEPPARATLLLVSHQPSALLPTIRSRCRVLRLAPLAPDAMTQALAQSGIEATDASLAELSGGSVGAALQLSLLDGLGTYAELLSILGTSPSTRPRARCPSGRGGRGARRRGEARPAFHLARYPSGTPCPSRRHGSSTTGRDLPRRSGIPAQARTDATVRTCLGYARTGDSGPRAPRARREP